jgi:hypothetical protein
LQCRSFRLVGEILSYGFLGELPVDTMPLFRCRGMDGGGRQLDASKPSRWAPVVVYDPGWGRDRGVRAL